MALTSKIIYTIGTQTIRCNGYEISARTITSAGKTVMVLKDVQSAFPMLSGDIKKIADYCGYDVVIPGRCRNSTSSIEKLRKSQTAIVNKIPLFVKRVARLIDGMASLSDSEDSDSDAMDVDESDEEIDDKKQRARTYKSDDEVSDSAEPNLTMDSDDEHFITSDTEEPEHESWSVDSDEEMPDIDEPVTTRSKRKTSPTCVEPMKLRRSVRTIYESDEE